ncbi:unnamed protein product [Merluccius merluccius]
MHFSFIPKHGCWLFPFVNSPHPHPTPLLPPESQKAVSSPISRGSSLGTLSGAGALPRGVAVPARWHGLSFHSSNRVNCMLPLDGARLHWPRAGPPAGIEWL